ncbi:hypothetical protein R1sor_002251 [Riccia sorocarpa]|uniref:CCHC-type domain-containing protein n=1 Tax=Riccia sorocarpa TaxID=122646 RepID=A0ABD3H490_9MARC
MRIAKNLNSERVTTTAGHNAWRQDARGLFGGMRDKLQKLPENPYLEKVSPSWGLKISDQDLLRCFHETGRAMHDTDLGNAKVLEWTSEDAVLLKIRKDQLTEAAVKIHLQDRFPLCDELETWVEADLGRKYQIRIVQLKLLGKQNSLLVLETKEQRDRLLQNASFSWGRESVDVLPWTPDFNPTKDTAKKVATWVEIPLADAWLEPLGDEFLQALGKPTFKTLNRGICKYPNIRGCVMVAEDADLPERLALKLPDGGVIMQEIRYQGAPNTCFRCKQPGHEARHCPSSGRAGGQPAREAKATTVTAGRTEVQDTIGKTPSVKPVPNEKPALTRELVSVQNLPPMTRSSSEKYLQQKKRDEELAANPFHALAGAFEVEMTEEVVTPEKVDAADIEMLPPSPCKPNNVSPKRKELMVQLGNTETPGTDPEPTPEERSDVGNLTLVQLMTALQRTKEKTLQEMKKPETRSEKDETRELQLNNDGNHEQNPLKPAEETRKPPPLKSGVRWAEVECGSEEEIERLCEEVAEAGTVSKAENENDVEAEVEVGSAGTGEGEPTHTAAEGSREKMETEVTTGNSSDTLVPNPEQTAERVQRPLAEVNEGTGESDPENEGKHELSGTPVIFAASKNPRRQLTVGDSQRKPGSWRRSGTRFNSGPDCQPNVEEDFSEEEGSSEGELNLK